MIESINITRTVHHPVFPLPGSCQSSSQDSTSRETPHYPPSSTGYVSRFPTHCSSSYLSNEYPQPLKASPVQPGILTSPSTSGILHVVVPVLWRTIQGTKQRIRIRKENQCYEIMIRNRLKERNRSQIKTKWFNSRTKTFTYRNIYTKQYVTINYITHRFNRTIPKSFEMSSQRKSKVPHLECLQSLKICFNYPLDRTFKVS